MTPASLVKIDGLSCGHNGKPAISGIDLDLPRGSITVLLGPNGSGKSTFLKTLAGSFPFLKGSVTLDGRPLSTFGARERAKLIAYVPQEEEPQYAFSVAETVIMGRLPYADKLFDTPEDVAAAEEAMERAACLDLKDRVVTELSGGELQRVLIGRALAQHPSLLLLDEPTSHLDVHFALDLAQLLTDLAAEGLTVIAAIHDLNLAARLAGNALLFGEGEVKAFGPIQEVLMDKALDEVFKVSFRRVQAEGDLLLSPSRMTAQG